MKTVRLELKCKLFSVEEFSTSSISFWFISVPSGICFEFLSRARSKICILFNILAFKLSRSLQFFSSLLMSTRVEVYYKPTQSFPFAAYSTNTM